MKVYLAGCGQIGQQLGIALLADGHEVIGLKRHDAAVGFPVMTIDLSDKTAVESLPLDANIIVFTVTPSSYDEAGYQQVYHTILGHVIDWAARHAASPLVVLVSSTGVYGQQQGEWVDENSVTEPTSFSGRWVLFGEQQLRRRLPKTLTVRFSGIYGAQRTRLVRKALSGEPIQQTPPLWTNRIHEADCVGVLQFLVALYQTGRPLDDIYVASDDTPVSQYEIIAHLCEALDRPQPPRKTDNLSENLNKRCDNRRIKSLGYDFRYPDYCSGYDHVLASFSD